MLLMQLHREATLAYNYRVRPRVSMRDLALSVGEPYTFEVEPYLLRSTIHPLYVRKMRMQVIYYLITGSCRPVNCIHFIHAHSIMLEKFWRVEEETLKEQDWGFDNQNYLHIPHANTRPERRGFKVVIHDFQWFNE